MSDYDSTALQSAVTAEETDGIIDAGDDGEIIENGEDVDGEERPEDCDCDEFHEDASLACWACYRAGFETVADG